MRNRSGPNQPARSNLGGLEASGGTMRYQIVVKGRQFAVNNEFCGVFELRDGAYVQHRGTSQTPRFKSEQHFRRYVQAMLRGER